MSLMASSGIGSLNTAIAPRRRFSGPDRRLKISCSTNASKVAWKVSPTLPLLISSNTSGWPLERV